MVPATSLAYELARSDIMKRQLKNPKTGKRVNKQLISMAYGQIGMIQALRVFFTYFVILGWEELPPNSPAGSEWPEMTTGSMMLRTAAENSEPTSRGKSWLLPATQPSLSVSWWHNGPTWSSARPGGIQSSNRGSGLFEEMALAAFLFYCPGVGVALRMYPLKPTWWLSVFSYSLHIFLYDKVRKVIVRWCWCPGGWWRRKPTTRPHVAHWSTMSHTLLPLSTPFLCTLFLEFIILYW